MQWCARRRGWRLAHWMPLAFCRSLCWLLRIKVHIHSRMSSSRPQLLVANHVSWTDILVLGCVHPLCFLAKKEVASWPVIGVFARLQGTVFVDRTHRRGLPAVNAAMAKAMRAGEPVVLFAEATTSDGTRIKRFHASHFAAAREVLRQDAACQRVVLQPVAVSFTRRNGLPLDRRGRADLAWYGDMTLLPHLWRLMRAGPLDCSLVFARPLAYERDADLKSSAAMCEQVIRAASRVARDGAPSQIAAEESGKSGAVSVLLNAETA